MPELPDLTVYVERLRAKAGGRKLSALGILDAFVLRTAEPSPEGFVGQVLEGVDRLGKRLILTFEGGGAAVIHLMVLGRLRWLEEGAGAPRRGSLVRFDFAEAGSLLLTESGSRRKASLHLLARSEELAEFDRGGLEILEADLGSFADALGGRRHTLKRALTDPTLISGVGNAYSDEILHRARLSPFKLTDGLDGEELERLFGAAVEVLTWWTDRLRAEAGDGFPAKVTAFREEMAVHGRWGKACPDCGAPVQRIRYADREANYCARCQTGGRVLADRSLSRLLKADWPRTLEELESRVRTKPKR